MAPLRARGVRVVVADGGSSDASMTIAQAGADVVVSAPRGRASQMNAGAAACAAQAYLFLHADTRLPAQADTLVLQALESGARWGRFDVHIGSNRPSLRMVQAMMNWRSRVTGIATGDQAMFVQATLWAECGGFADLPLMEDIELSKRLKRVAPPACLRAQVVTSARRWLQHGTWRTIGLMWRLRLAYFCGADPQVLAVRYGYRPRTR